LCTRSGLICVLIICCARSNAARGGEQVLALRFALCQVDPDCCRRASPLIQSVRSQRRRAHFPLSAAMFVFPQMMSLLVSLASAKLLAPISTLGEFVFFYLQSVHILLGHWSLDLEQGSSNYKNVRSQIGRFEKNYE
jgi:hypothetical protein